MTPEQQSLLEKADRTWQAANVLLSRGFFDSAASRAYYSTLSNDLVQIKSPSPSLGEGFGVRALYQIDGQTAVCHVLHSDRFFRRRKAILFSTFRCYRRFR